MNLLILMNEAAHILRRESVYIWYYIDLQMRQIFGYWVLGMVIGSAVSVFAKDRIHSLFAGMQGKKWDCSESFLHVFWALPRPCACTEPFPLPLPSADRV